MTAIVAVARCPLYLRPDPRSELADEALLGWRVTVSERRGDLCQVVTDYRYGGWAPADCLVTDPARVLAWDPLPKQTLSRPWADVLSRPTVRGVPLMTVLRGGVVGLWGPAVDGWQPVALPDGRRGCLPLGDTFPDPPSHPTRDGVCRAALGYLGAPYRWGGKTPLGVDCSGLTFMAYRLQGVTIFRDARPEPGFPVETAPLEARLPGDLLYYPGHVALYLGDDRYVHATAHPDARAVTINSLDSAADGYRPDLAPDRVVALGRCTAF